MEKSETKEPSLADSLLSEESPGRASAYLLIKLDKVMSETDTLVNGRIDVQLRYSHFSIAPLKLQLAVGMLQTEFSYCPNQDSC